MDGGDGCVTPSVADVQDGTYKPLSRPLFIYVKNTSFKRPEVEAFMKYIVDNEEKVTQAVGLIPLTDSAGVGPAKSQLQTALQAAGASANWRQETSSHAQARPSLGVQPPEDPART